MTSKICLLLALSLASHFAPIASFAEEQMEGQIHDQIEDQIRNSEALHDEVELEAVRATARSGNKLDRAGRKTLRCVRSLIDKSAPADLVIKTLWDVNQEFAPGSTRTTISAKTAAECEANLKRVRSDPGSLPVTSLDRQTMSALERARADYVTGLYNRMSEKYTTCQGITLGAHLALLVGGGVGLNTSICTSSLYRRALAIGGTKYRAIGMGGAVSVGGMRYSQMRCRGIYCTDDLQSEAAGFLAVVGGVAQAGGTQGGDGEFGIAAGLGMSIGVGHSAGELKILPLPNRNHKMFLDLISQASASVQTTP